MEDERSSALWIFALVLQTTGALSSHSATFVPPSNGSSTWNAWSSLHPDPDLAARQQLEWQELTLGTDGPTESPTGLTGGLLRLRPHKELPSHYHPAPFGEIYHFTRGNGEVVLGEFTPGERLRAIAPGLHVNIPAEELHGIRAGSEGCEFVWMFPARRWRDVPYLYVDPRLPSRNLAGREDDPVQSGPISMGMGKWREVRARALARSGGSGSSGATLYGEGAAETDADDQSVPQGECP